jgi:hypothetical protein
MDDTTKVLLSTAVVVVLAFAGYWAKYRNDLQIARRKDQLDRVNRQLNELYGPLYAHLRGSTVVWDAFFHTYSPSQKAFFSDIEPSKEQKAQFRLWITNVFMPMNNAMVEACTKHADLLVDDEMPKCLLDLAAHVAAYQAVLKRWDAQDFSVHTSPLNFPQAALEAYVIPTCKRLKLRELAFLGDRSPR